jgi:hypothetical protein
MKLKKLTDDKLNEVAHLGSDDFYYNLFDGGYLDPEELLDNTEDAVRVREAMRVISEYSDLLSDIDLGEEDTE